MCAKQCGGDFDIERNGLSFADVQRTAAIGGAMLRFPSVVVRDGSAFLLSPEVHHAMDPHGDAKYCPLSDRKRACERIQEPSGAGLWGTAGFCSVIRGETGEVWSRCVRIWLARELPTTGTVGSFSNVLAQRNRVTSTYLRK